MIVRLDSRGAELTSESGDHIDYVAGDPSAGEIVRVVSEPNAQAIVTIQYAPSENAPAEITPDEDALLPEPTKEIIGNNTFLSGNFGDTVDRTIDVSSTPEFASAVTQTSTSFDWSTDGSSEFRVTRDGDFVGESTDGAFVDANLDADSTYEYQLETIVTEKTESSLRVMTVHTLPDSAKLDANDIQALAYQPFTTAYVYKTFIPNQYVSSFLAQLGCGLASGEKFAGDNRGFANPGAGAPYTTPSYRTQMFLNVNWGEPAPYDVVYVKSVGQTKKLSSTNAVLATKSASINGMVFQNPTRSGDLVTFGVSHEVGDPFCSAGAVRYSMSWVKIYRSGTVSIQGSRQPVPSHEAYARFSDSSGTETWKTLYQATGTNFGCLMPSICLSENINKSVSG